MSDDFRGAERNPSFLYIFTVSYLDNLRSALRHTSGVDPGGSEGVITHNKKYRSENIFSPPQSYCLSVVPGTTYTLECISVEKIEVSSYTNFKISGALDPTGELTAIYSYLV